MIAAIALLLSAPTFALDIRVDGAVGNPGHMDFPQGSRLDDMAIAAVVDEDAYFAGAAWYRPAEVEAQRRLKAGVIFSLRILARRSALDDKPAFTALAQKLDASLNALPVTGRLRHALDPAELASNPASNSLLMDGDYIHYPRRPATVRITGAVHADCELPFVALQSTRAYLKQCAIDRTTADRDAVFVVQPDGAVFRQGIALWNRDARPLPMPGAIILVPIDGRVMADIDPNLDREIAAFLATQPLPGEAP